MATRKPGHFRKLYLALRASIVGVSVWSIFWRGQCLGAVSVQVRLIFEVPHGLLLACMHLTAQNIVHTKTSSIPKH